MTKRWQCTVCGYIHTGEEPPEFCPVCGADRSKFILLQDEAVGTSQHILSTFKIHPVAAHFPAGLVPTAALFLFLYLFSGNSGFETTSFWLLLVATAVVPVSLSSGLYDWRKIFGGQRALIFTKKLALALILLSLGLLSTTLRYGYPDLLATSGWPRWLYLGALAGMLGCVILLGHYGAILVALGAAKKPSPQGLLPDGNSADWFREIITQAPDAILAADTMGIIRLWNRGAERIFGTPAAKAIGQSLDLIIPENLRQRHWEGWARVMQTGESRYEGQDLLRVPAIRVDGSRLSAEFSIVMLKNGRGEITGVAAILRDISVQWERERTLKSQLEACRQPESP